MAENYLQASPNAELAVIGCAMIEDWATHRVLQMLERRDFDDARTAELFGAIKEIKEARPDLPVDVTIVSDWLLQRCLMPKIGAEFISKCMHAVTTTVHVEHYIKFVKDASIHRQIDRQLGATTNDRTPENVKDLGDLILALQGNRGVHIFDMRTDLGPALDSIMDRPKKGIATGYHGFDSMADGIMPEELWTIGARPGAGKTAMMLKMACNMAQELAMRGNPDNECVLYLTTEMTVRSLVQRILPMATGIPHSKFRSGSLSKDEMGRVIGVCADGLNTFPLKMMGKSMLSIDDIRGAVYQAKPKVVFIDYLQRCKLPRAESTAYGLQALMVELKSLMVDCQIAGFIGCQTDRELDKFPDVAPTMSHLKGSGGIESESDGIILLWEPTPAVVMKRADWVAPRPGCRAIEGIIRKNRGGEKDVAFDLELEGQLIKLTDRLQYSQGEMHAS